MKTITILSGKGGVGKSSITASLAITLAKRRRIICADCDVDASNLALVFGIKEKDFEEYLPISTIQKAVFDLSKCNSCRKCFEECYFDAIELVNDKPKLKEFSCEGCGVCQLVCPVDAIKLVDEKNAKIGYAKTKYGFRIFSAQLDVGASGSGKIVSAVKKKAEALAQDAEIMLVDSSAGVGCPVIASVSGSDYALLVTEPTPSGFSDMKRAIKIVNHFKEQKVGVGLHICGNANPILDDMVNTGVSNISVDSGTDLAKAAEAARGKAVLIGRKQWMMQKLM